MSNFNGHVRKNADSFKPKSSGGEDVVIDRVAAGGYEPVHYFEVKKADQPVLDTAPTPRTDGAGENEIGLRGAVDHPNNDGNALYLVQEIKRIYRQAIAGKNADTLSLAERRALRDQIIDGVGSYGQGDAQRAVFELASLLGGLEEELSNTPDFLRAPKPPTPDSDRVGRIGSDYLRLKAEPTGTLLKSFGQGVTVYCRILHKNDALREVHGVIAEELPDKANEIFDYASSEPHFRKWSSEALERTTAAGLPPSFGNVRAQHTANAVGKLTDIQFDSANKRIPVVAKIVDDDTWRKIQAGVLTGFSIGGSYLSKWADGSYTRYTAKPAEVSIVDNPCMPGATFSMVKDAPGNPELAELNKQVAILTATIRTILARRAGVVTDSGSSGSRFVTKDAGGGNDPRQLLKTALANGKPAEFKGQVVKSSFVPAETGEQRNRDAAAREAMTKALNNGTNIDQLVRKS